MKRFAVILSAGVLALSGCATTQTQDGTEDNSRAVTGAIIGGIVGGVVANNTGEQSTGKTVAGVLVGAGVGGAIGHNMDQREAELRRIAAERDAKDMEVERLREDLVRVSVSSEASFDFGQAVVKPEFKPTLNRVAQVLMNDPGMTILIVGHTDSVGSEDYNYRLSERRASAVAAYLIQQGVPSSQLRTEGRGESEPRASNGTPEGRAQNRRVEIYLQGH